MGCRLEYVKPIQNKSAMTWAHWTVIEYDVLHCLINYRKPESCDIYVLFGMRPIITNMIDSNAALRGEVESIDGGLWKKSLT